LVGSPLPVTVVTFTRTHGWLHRLHAVTVWLQFHRTLDSVTCGWFTFGSVTFTVTAFTTPAVSCGYGYTRLHTCVCYVAGYARLRWVLRLHTAFYIYVCRLRSRLAGCGWFTTRIYRTLHVTHCVTFYVRLRLRSLRLILRLRCTAHTFSLPYRLHPFYARSVVVGCVTHAYRCTLRILRFTHTLPLRILIYVYRLPFDLHVYVLHCYVTLHTRILHYTLRYGSRCYVCPLLHTAFPLRLHHVYGCPVGYVVTLRLRLRLRLRLVTLRCYYHTRLRCFTHTFTRYVPTHGLRYVHVGWLRLHTRWVRLHTVYRWMSDD